MLVVVTPATATRLTTATDTRAALGLAAADPSDAVLNEMIDQASQAIVDYCRRPFGRETVRETLRGRDITEDGILLSRGPVVSISSVTTDGTLLASSLYEVDTDRNSIFYVSDGYRYAWRANLGVFEYVAGYKLPGELGRDLPKSVERAAQLEIGAYLSTRSRDPLIKSEDVAGVGSASYWVPGESSRLLSPEAQTLLQTYRYPALG